MRSRRFFSSLGHPVVWLVASLAATACVTPPKRAEPSEVPSNLQKAGTKQDTTPPVAPKVAPEAAGPSVDDQLLFVRRQSVPDAPFGVAEYQFLASLPQGVVAASVTEAAVAIGLVRTVLHPLTGSVPSFQETDLSLDAAAAKKAPAIAGRKLPTLEQLCKERNLDLATALTDNPLLGNAGVAKQTNAALQQGDNSKEFIKRVSDALKGQARMWNEVAGAIPSPSAGPDSVPELAPLPPMPEGAKAGAGPQLGAGASPTTLTPATTPVPGPGPDIPTLLPSGGAGAVAAGAAGSEGAIPPGPPPAPGEHPLAEAQALADRGDYASAVKKAQAVPEGSPQATQAKDKIKEFSNLAVQDLRKKAASAFQTAMPVTDPKTKAEYLKQAKSFLEEALKDYPEATQLPTVRENLRIITQDLDKLPT